jgi:hypothetical protein
MLKTASNFVLGRPSPCDVPKEYASVAKLPAAAGYPLLFREQRVHDRFEHP